jgi:hypothetical protein
VAGAASPETSVAGGAGAASGATPGVDPLEQIYSLLSVTDQKDKDCIKGGLDPATPVTGPTDPAVVKALITCQPPSLVDLAASQVTPLLPKATPEQVTCVSKEVLKAVATSDSLDISALMGGLTAVPKELQADLIAAASGCGVPEADLKAAFRPQS